MPHISLKNGHVKMQGKRLGGAIPLLHKEVIKPITRGGDISNSNKIIGIITPQPAKQSIEGGQLLQNIHFGSHKHKPDNERIKFIF